MTGKALDGYREVLDRLESESRRRSVRGDAPEEMTDMSSNDYLGLGARGSEFDAELSALCPDAGFTSSASRLLAGRQSHYRMLESYLEEQYGRPALLFNSGYHANVGCASALAIPGTLFVADKAIHASVLDGFAVGKADFRRFTHNDMDALRRILDRHAAGYERVIVVVESIYSMDGDEAPLRELAAIKREYPGLLLYLDEAHGVGVRGCRGLGLAEELGVADDFDLIVGTFGKALASAGAFVIASPLLIDFLVNTARSFIFSTALPPVCAARSLLMMRKAAGMEEERRHLARLADMLRDGLHRMGLSTGNSTSQIVPLIVGDAARTLRISAKLREAGFDALAIRRPTVAAGTERIRFSLNSSLSESDISTLLAVLKTILES